MVIKKENQEKIWDSIAETWNKYKVESFGDKEGLLSKFIKKTDKKVLDLGCGSGRNFFKFPGVIYGVDFSSKMLKLAEKNAKKRKIKIILKKSPAYKLDFKNNFFDRALFIATLHCVDSALKRKKALKELYRVIKPGGKAIITVWNKDSKRWRNKPKEKLVSWELSDDKNKSNKVWRYYYLYSPSELKKLIESVGFKIIKESFPEARNIIMVLEKPKK